MSIHDELLAGLPDGPVLDIRVGAYWTAVVVDLDGRRCCGLSSTLLAAADDHHHGGGPAVQEAGHYLKYSALELAGLARSESILEAAMGTATINALMPEQEQHWVDLNAEEVVVEQGAGKRVAVVGHFPFIPRWKEIADTLWVLEKRPRGEDLEADQASQILPQADIAAISGTSLLNHTFEELIAFCRPDALVLVLGPSTPLSPILFDHGVDIISGSVVTDIDAVLAAASQGANFRQLKKFGVRLVTMRKN